MKPVLARARKKLAFTIVEMALAVSLTLGVAAALIGLINQQVDFATALSNFRFLREEAPQINTLLTTIVNKSDSYRIYPSSWKARTYDGPVRENGKAIWLRFRNPDGTSDQAIIAFETVAGERRLNYYFRAYNASSWPNNATWTISTAPDVVNFSNTTGVLEIELVGSAGEQITYAGNPD